MGGVDVAVLVVLPGRQLDAVVVVRVHVLEAVALLVLRGRGHARLALPRLLRNVFKLDETLLQLALESLFL